MKYCPNCGAEYRPDVDRCWDCQAGLVDEPPEPSPGPAADEIWEESSVVFRSGRRMDAELVRARLEADGLEARIWSSGLGPWRMESALTEVTGVPNDFNSHRVVVAAEDMERAMEVLGEVPAADDAARQSEAVEEQYSPKTFLSSLRPRWALVAFAVALLLVVAGGVIPFLIAFVKMVLFSIFSS